MRVALLFGGRSGEHEVSVMSARSVFGALLEGGFDVVCVGITREGHWVFVEAPAAFFEQESVERGCGEVTVDLGPSCYILPDPLRPGIWANGTEVYESVCAQPHDPVHVPEGISAHAPAEAPVCEPAPDQAYQPDRVLECKPAQESPCDAEAGSRALPEDARNPRVAGVRIDIDVVFPVLHGTFGEDGTVQGLLELSGIPYVGSGTLASAICMDKDTTKIVLSKRGIPIVPAITVERWKWQSQRDEVLEEIYARIDFPVFVKPSASGSSLGVSKVKDGSGLPAAIDNAFLYDLKVLVEPAQEGALEIECSVLGNEKPEASIPGQIVPSREFYDYEAKYLDRSTRLVVPAPLEDSLADKVRAAAIDAFRAAGCSGLARVDFFVYPDTGELYVNELNTLPGFTEVSMYPKLWEASGLPYSRLVARLVELALERKRTSHRHVKRVDA
ncbi:MAG: D-alanine--D-alanine ligase family protein [Bacillota bacterium]|jgi:D-alanine-D-alanine ligase|nr:D-alanine--D-alanine ligase [Candidatus Fermentithermobacillaceae bacterium]